MDSQFIKRLKSFGWRLGVAAVLFALNWIVENISGLGLPSWAVGIISLGIGEITKFLNSQYQLGKMQK